MAYTLVPTELIVDGAITSAKLDTNIAISGTLGVTGEVTLATHLIMGDNDKIKIGTGGDLEIYHDGSNSYISNSTGNIYLGDTNGAVHIQAKLNEESIICAADGAVTLYHDNSPKLATSSAGATVTGTLAATLSTAAQPNITSLGTLTALTGGTGDLNWDSATLFVDSSANAVGIGTTSPTSGGGLTLSSSTTSQGFIDFKNTVDGDNGYIGNAKALITGATTNQLGIRGGTSGIAFSVAASEAIRIDASGSLLVNSSSAGSSRLKVVGDASRYGILSENLSGYGAFSLKSTTVAQTWSIGAVDNSSNSDLFIYGGSSAGTKVTLASTGNVGIGMTSPQRKFEVSTANAEMSHFGQIAATNGHYTGITLGYREDNTNYRKAGIIQEQIGDGAARGHLHLCVDTGADNNSINPADSKLMIHGTSGNVGIGNSSPQQRLTVGAGSGSELISIYAGTGSASGIHFTDTNTSGDDFQGFVTYDHTADALRFGTAEEERVRIDVSGAVGIGQVPETARFSGHDILQVGGRATFLGNDTVTATGQTVLLDNLYYDASGNFQHRGDSRGVAMQFVEGQVIFSNSNQTTGTPTVTPRMTLDNSGRLLVGATSTTAPAGTIFPLGYRGRAGTGGTETNNFNIAWTGSAANLWIDTTNQGAITVSSDYRIKRNIETQTADALSRVKKIRPVTYQPANYGEIFKESDEIKEGFIAHELAEIIPSAVQGEKDDPSQIQSLKVDALCSVLTKAIQEQQTIIDDLKSRIETLEG